LYDQNLKEFLEEKGGEGFNSYRQRAMEILQKESALEEIVRLIGVDSLSQKDQFLLQISKSIREDFLHQNAFLDVDSFTSLKKQYSMIKEIVDLYEQGLKDIVQGKKIEEIMNSEVREKLSKMKLIKEENI